MAGDQELCHGCVVLQGWMKLESSETAFRKEPWVMKDGIVLVLNRDVTGLFLIQ